MSEEQVTVSGKDRPREPEGESFTPLVDIYEDEEGTTHVVAELPGASSESLDIRVDKGVLTISAEAERETPDEDYSRTYTGFVSGRYFRAFALSDEVDRDNIRAELSDGLLRITLPRAPEARTHKIEIQ